MVLQNPLNMRQKLDTIEEQSNGSDDDESSQHFSVGLGFEDTSQS
jgi:hypothetical protein